MSEILLQLDKVSKHFGGITAVNQVSLALQTGQIKGLIGPNGAGKTTLFNMITGVYPVSGGTIRMQQHLLTGLPVHRIARHGIARTFQTVRLFTNLSLAENVMVGFHEQLRGGWLATAFGLPWTRQEEHQYRERARQLLDFVGLSQAADTAAASLPYGQQRLLEIARALATKPRLLLLDEPAAGLNIAEKLALGRLVQAIRQQGVTVLLVEHDMDLVMNICDELVVLEFGTKIAEGDPAAIRNHPKVIAAYLGEEDGDD